MLELESLRMNDILSTTEVTRQVQQINNFRINEFYINRFLHTKILLNKFVIDFDYICIFFDTLFKTTYTLFLTHK